MIVSGIGCGSGGRYCGEKGWLPRQTSRDNGSLMGCEEKIRRGFRHDRGEQGDNSLAMWRRRRC